MRTKTSTYAELCKRLGQLDHERRDIINQLHNSPEYIVKYVNDKLNTFVKNKNWFTRLNNKNENTYFSLSSFGIDDKSLKKTTKKSVLINVTLVWNVYDETIKKVITENITISAFNEIDNQILNGRQLAPNFSEKEVQKNILNQQKIQLEQQLKKIKSDLAAL